MIVKKRGNYTSRRTGPGIRRSKKHQHTHMGSLRRFKRFIRALSWSTLISFVVSTWALYTEKLPLPELQSWTFAQFPKASFPEGFEFELEQFIEPLADKIRSVYTQITPVVQRTDTSNEWAEQSTDAGTKDWSGESYQTQFNDCPEFFPDSRFPVVPKKQELSELCFSSFAILYNGTTKTPVFVAQRLDRKKLQQAKKVKRTDRFYEEARLRFNHRAHLDDYRDSGYDRGHMAPAGDMHTEEGMEQSFSLANIVPQDPQHNRGAWNSIERATRKYVSRAPGDVYVFTGPFYDDQPKTIGERQVHVPKYLYKVVYNVADPEPKVHWHENNKDALAGQTISYDDFLRHTGLHLLPSLSEPPVQ